jgi:penicillin-binding protein-related factor A (putative recombinase)
MGMTPEGIIKRRLDHRLKELGVWHFKPASGAFGRAGIPDYILCVRGRFVGIEAKADKTKKPTDLQAQCMAKIEEAGGKCFVVYSTDTISKAVRFIKNLQDTA